MDEVRAFCLRMLGPGEGAEAAEHAARDAADGDDRVSLLTAAATECRGRERGALAPPAASDEPVRTADPGTAGGDRGAEPATEDPAGPTEPQAEDDPRTGGGTPDDPRSGGGTTDDPPTGDPGLGDPAGLAAAVAAELAEATAGLPQRQREALALRELLGLSHAEIASVVGVDPGVVAPLLARSRLRLRSALRGEGKPVPECTERDRGLRTIARRQDHEDVSSADDDWLVEHLGHCPGCGRAHGAMLEASACYRAWQLPDSTDTAAAAPAAPPAPAAGAAPAATGA